MKKTLIELRKKLLFAGKCIRTYNDPMAADDVIGFSLLLVNDMIEKCENEDNELLTFAIEMVKRYPNSPWITEQGNKAIKKLTCSIKP